MNIGKIIPIASIANTESRHLMFAKRQTKECAKEQQRNALAMLTKNGDLKRKSLWQMMGNFILLTKGVAKIRFRKVLINALMVFALSSAVFITETMRIMDLSGYNPYIDNGSLIINTQAFKQVVAYDYRMTATFVCCICLYLFLNTSKSGGRKMQKRGKGMSNMWGEKNEKNNMPGYGIGSIVYRRTAIGVETRTVGALRGEIKSMTFDELGDIYFKIVYENGLEETVSGIDSVDFCTFDEAISNERERYKKTDQHGKKPVYIPLDFVDGRYIAYFINKDRIDTEPVDSIDLSDMLYGDYRSEVSYMWIDEFQEYEGKKYFVSRELAENELERIKAENTKYFCTCKVCGNKFIAKKPDIKRNSEKQIALAKCDSCHTLREVDISE